MTALTHLCPSHAKRAAVVKGNAYGHGMKEVVAALDGQIDFFQVDDLNELRELRQITQTPTLVLGYVALHEIEEALRLGCELAVYDTERLPLIQRTAETLGIRAKIHLKIDALLGRQGILPDAVPSFLATLERCPAIDLVALYSHFANIEDTTDLTHAQSQTEAFDRAFIAAQNGRPNLIRHESATSGVMAYESESRGNLLVRLGIGLYGLYPSTALERTHLDLGLRPAMRWRSHLAQVKILPARHPVGYGLTYITASETRIGIVPQGYSDGYDRGLSNSAQVLVHGRRCPVIGRIAMNMFAIDLTNVPEAQVEDEVVLLGTQEGETITAEELALRIGTINYEITTRVSPLLPRTVR